MRIPSEAELNRVYGECQESKKRYESLTKNFSERFGHDKAEFFSAPGRTEIVGNHTDHNGGKVLAASIDLDTIGAAYPNQTNVIRIVSEGYRKEITVNLSALDKIIKGSGTVALVAGMVEAAEKKGFRVEGFDAYVSTRVISAAGVSSSASFEMLVCSIINYFFNDSRMDITDYAKIGQYAENVYWLKASGLMDQMACAAGGAILLDFSEETPTYRQMEFSFEKAGYHLVIVNTGKGHADLSQEYSDIPSEMKQTAAAAGAGRLCETDMEHVLEKVSEIDNDRAILRAFHFFEENRRVVSTAKAVEAGDYKEVLRLLDESGNSSWEWLQNCYSLQNCKEQKITLALALTRLFLNKVGDGICRVHGGGFAGVIMCVVPESESENYVNYISNYFGRSNVYPMGIRAVGAAHLGLE